MKRQSLLKKRLLLVFSLIILIVSILFLFNKDLIWFTKDISELNSLSKENEKLKSRIDEYDNLLIEKKYLEDENKNLKQIEEATNNIQKNYDSIQASVIHRNGESKIQWYENLVINKGANQKIKKNMLVVTSANGLIGEISSVRDNSATVQLLTYSDTVQLSVTSKGNFFGILKGANDGSLIIKVNSNDRKKVKIGDEIITSGLGERYPKGIKLGKVEKFGQGEFGLTLEVYVKPTADFYNIEDVIIIKEKQEQP